MAQEATGGFRPEEDKIRHFSGITLAAVLCRPREGVARRTSQAAVIIQVRDDSDLNPGGGREGNKMCSDSGENVDGRTDGITDRWTWIRRRRRFISGLNSWTDSVPLTKTGDICKTAAALPRI